MSRAAHESNVAGSGLYTVAQGAITTVLANGVLGTPVYTGAGVYTFPLNDAGGGVSRTEHDFLPIPQGATARGMTATWDNQNQVTVRAFDADGVAADCDFTFSVLHSRRNNN